MSRVRGVSQASLVNTSTATVSLTDYYCGRWVSDPINQSGIAANTWTWNFASKEDNSNANFPTSGSTAGYVNCYVWRPSSGGSKIGTILDGNTGILGSEPINDETVNPVTFTGAAVASAAAGDVIILEVWFRITQSAATAYTQTFYFDGPIVNTTIGTSVTNHATFVETPENITFTDTYSPTKLYLHNTTSGLPTGTLPTAEQSSKTVTASCNFEGSQTTNRLMDVNIGASQASLALATPANTNANTYYVSRWVSPAIYQTSIPAAAWTYNFAAKETNTSANFPVTSSNKAVAICCYVWKPSDGTKYANILDGNTTGTTVNEGAANTEVSENVDFLGAAVSSLTSGDACIVFEAWFNVTQGAATSYTDTFYYDGTTETLTTGTTVSNHAAFLQFLGNDGINFTSVQNLTRTITESSISVGSGTVARVLAANRTISESSISLGAGTVSRVKGNVRSISEGAITVAAGTITRALVMARTISGGAITVGAGSVSRIKAAIRSISENAITVGAGSISKVSGKARSINESAITVGSGTVTRIKTAIRNIPNSVTIGSGSISRIVANSRTIIESITVGAGSVSRSKAAIRSIPETVTIGAGILSRAVTNSRNIIESSITVNGGTVSRIRAAIRSLPESISVGSGSVTRAVANSRTISESSISVSAGNITRILSSFRSIIQSVSISGGTVTRAVQNSRTIVQSISVGDSIQAIKSGDILRTINDSITVGAGTISRAVVNNRTITQSVSIGVGTCNRIVGFARSCTGNVIVSAGIVTRTVAFTRIISETIVTVGTGTVSRIKHAVRIIVNPTINISDALVRSVTNSRVINQSVSVGAGTVSRVFAFSRTITESSISIGNGTVSRVVAATRNILDSVIVGTGSISRAISNSRIINQSVSVGAGIVTRSVSYGRTITESTISVFDSIANVIIHFVAVDFVPKLLHDFTEDIGKMVMDWFHGKYDIGDPEK
jgi:hypothetical protein